MRRHSIYIIISTMKLNLCNAFLKAEYTMIEFKECGNVFKGFLLRVPWLLILFTVMEHFGPNIFIFLLILFLFSFYFRTMKKARDKEVTWCDIISLKLDGRVWKMTSGHLEYTWWPWVGHEAGMRMKHGYKGRVIY